MISIDEFKKVEIRAGKILKAEEIEGSDKLLKLEVDFGSSSALSFGGTKQVLSGIKKYFPDSSSLVGVTCAFVTNLEPREMMGLKSEAMIMASSSEDSFSLLKMESPPGSIVK